MYKEIQQNLRSLAEVMQYLCFSDLYKLKLFLTEKKIPIIRKENEEFADISVIKKVTRNEMLHVTEAINKKLEEI